MLVKVRRLNYAGCNGYAPAREDAVVNTDEIVSAVKCEARGDGPFMQLTFRNGTTMVVVGRVDDLLSKIQG